MALASLLLGARSAWIVAEAVATATQLATETIAVMIFARLEIATL